MADKLEPLVISIQLETERLKSQLDAVQGQVEKMGRGVADQSQHVDKLGGSFKGLAGTIGKFLGAAAIISFLSDSAKAAAEDAQSMGELDRAMKATTNSTDAQVASADAQIQALSDMSGVVDDKIRPAYATLLRATGDNTKAMELQKLAMDVSAGTGKDLGQVSAALAKAYSGNGAALQKLIPGIKSGAGALGQLGKQFKGAAEKAGNNNPYGKLGVAMDRIKETLGKALMPALNIFSKLLLKLMPFINKLANVLGIVLDAVMPLVDTLITMLMPAFDGIMKVVMVIVQKVFPPLIKLINDVLMPVIQILVDIIVQYLVPYLSWLADILGNVLGVAVDIISDAFKNLMKILGPIWENVLKPIIDGLMNLLGIKVTPEVEVKTNKAADSVAAGDYNFAGMELGGGGAGGTGGNAQESAAQKRVNAQKKFVTGMLDAEKKYTQGLKDALKERDNALVTLTEEHLNKIAEIQKDGATKLADIVKQSQDRLKSAFANVTNFDAGQMFLNAGASISNFVTMLKDKLASGRKLAEDAASLAGAGYSQTFIEQIMAQGPMMAGELTKQLLQGSPQQASEIQGLFADLGSLQTHGVDKLATDIYNKSGLATEELKTAYVTAQGELATALDAENKAYAKSAEDLQVKFEDSVAKLAVARNNAISKSLNALNDALGTNAKSLSAALKIVDNALGTTSSKVATQIDQIIAAGKSATTLVNNNQDLPILTSSVTPTTPGITGSTNSTAINTSVNVSTNATPSDIGTAVVNNIKFNLPFTVGATA